MDNKIEPDQDLKKLQVKLTELALKLADIAKIKLDFSVNSVKEVDRILDQIHREYKMKKNEEGISGMALELAAYIVTVIERNIKLGKWERDSKEFGKDSFPYDLGKGNIIFPYAWCLKRIYNDSGEDVWSKFNLLVLNK